MLLIATPKLIWGVVSVFILICFIGVLIKVHFSREYKDFNLLKIFAYDEFGHPSATKIRINIAFIITCWAFVYLTMASLLSEWYVLIFLSAWVTDNIMGKKQKLENIIKVGDKEVQTEDSK
jgi:hypothetical protein